MTDNLEQIIDEVVAPYADSQGISRDEGIRLLAPYLWTILSLTYFGPCRTHAPLELFQLLAEDDNIASHLIRRSPQVDTFLRSVPEIAGALDGVSNDCNSDTKLKNAFQFFLNLRPTQISRNFLKGPGVALGAGSIYIDYGHTVAARLRKRILKPFARHLSSRRLDQLLAPKHPRHGVSEKSAQAVALSTCLSDVQAAKRQLVKSGVVSEPGKTRLYVGSPLYSSDAVRLLAHTIRAANGLVIGNQHGGGYLEYYNSGYMTELINSNQFRTSFPGDLRKSRSELLDLSLKGQSQKMGSGVVLFLDPQRWSEIIPGTMVHHDDYRNLVSRLAVTSSENVGVRFKGRVDSSMIATSDDVRESQIRTYRSYRRAITSRGVTVHFGLNTTWMDSLRRRRPFLVFEIYSIPKTEIGIATEGILTEYGHFYSFQEWQSFDWAKLEKFRSGWSEHKAQLIFDAIRRLHQESEAHEE